MLSWGNVKQKGFSDEKHHYRRSLELHILPYIGNKPMSDIKPRDILNCLRRVEEQGYFNVSHRILMLCSMIFRFAVVESIIERNICLDLKGALISEKTKNFPSITDPVQVGELLRRIDNYSGTFQVKSALQLAPLLFIRPVELRSLEWDMIDFEKNELRYFVSKTSVDHIVPLSVQAIKILEELQQFTGGSRYVFMSHHHSNKHIGDATLNNALRVMGYDKTQMTIHGFRAMARTLLDERLGFRPDFIELQLAHKVTGIMGATYNRSSHLKERHLMMQKWSDYLDSLKG
jgi:integrase